MKNSMYDYYDQIEKQTDLKALLDYCYENYKSDFVLSYKEGKKTERKTFEQLRSESIRLATVLINKGWKARKIAAILPNCYEWVLAYFAIQLSGNVIVPIDPRLPAEEQVGLIRQTNVNVAFIIGVNTCLQDVCEIFDLTGLIIESHKITAQELVVNPDAVSMIYFTSGSTGQNKGVMLSQHNMCFDVCMITKLCSPEGGKKAIATLPFHHTLGITTFLFYMLYGLETYIERSPKYLMKDLAEVSPAVTAWVPAVAESIYNSVLRQIDSPMKKMKYTFAKILSRFMVFIGIDVRRIIFRRIHIALGGNLRFLVCGGAPLKKEIINEFRIWGIHIMPGYGITECSPVISTTRNYNWRDGSAGLVLPEVRVKITDDCEILVKGDNVFHGYYGDEHSTKEAFSVDGWFKTGDLGYIDADGFLYVIGRKKNLIILSNGENISPEELEEKLISYFPMVKEVVVFQEEDRIIGEVYVDRTEYRTRILTDLTSFNRTINVGKQIHEVRFRETPFPKTNSGKIKRINIGGKQNV